MVWDPTALKCGFKSVF
uniref:Uncharacterized protein n=1 Tax=Anguilla anguilla TaxID=7936 RepID=A0A0E9XD56_ANGAN